MLEAIMALVFVAIDPDTTGDHCPAVFVEEETGDLLFQGWTVTDPQILAEVAQHSPIADNEATSFEMVDEMATSRPVSI